MHHRTDVSCTKLVCACVLIGVLTCYIVSNLGYMRYDRDGNVIIFEMQDVNDLRARPTKPVFERTPDEFYATFSCDKKSKPYNKLCSVIPPQDILNIPIPNFLPRYKNPCWSNEDRSDGSVPIRCLPYFYVLAPPRCGSTDIYTRLSQHPQVANPDEKDIHWFSKGRYVFETADESVSAPTILNYTDYFVNASSEIFISFNQDRFHDKITGDYSPSTVWDNMFTAKYAAMTNTTEQRIAQCLHHLDPSAKFVVMLRDPVERAYSDYLYFDEETEKSKEMFHNIVEEGIAIHYECQLYQPLQYCIDYRPKNKGKSGRLFIGIYHQHLEDYFKYFPRDKFLFLKLEDYSKNLRQVLSQIISFLELNDASEAEYHAMLTMNVSQNLQTEESIALGDMLPETRNLLKQFYKPYNDKLGELLGERFNYNND